MDAVYRVDGNRVVTSPNPAGPWDATARLADERGYFGRAVQSLVIEKR
jgi:hypothetical protein